MDLKLSDLDSSHTTHAHNVTKVTGKLKRE